MQAVATFAIPCRNAGPFLEPLLESLLAQTRQDFELLLVDDASDDDSVAIAQRIGGDRIEIHVNAQPLGLAGNWNRCAALVRTSQFCLAHMDDVYEPPYLERMVAALAVRPQAALAHCRVRAIDADGSTVESAAERYKERFWRGLQQASPAEVFVRLFRGNFIACPTALYRTDAWRAVGGVETDLGFAPDWKLWFRLLLDGHQLAAVPDTLVAYRRHDASETARQVRDHGRYREELAVLDFAASAGVAAGLLDSHLALQRTAVRNNVLYDAYRDLRAGDRAAARAKVEFLRDHAPTLRNDRVVRAFARLVELGSVGKIVLSVGLRAALLGSRR